MSKQQQIRDADYRTLAEFRYLFRCFMEFSETMAQQKGLPSRQHQALLAIKGFPEESPTIGALAEKLRIHHNTAVELVNRLAAVGLVRRQTDADDRRCVRLFLTKAAEHRLAELSAIHLEELRRLRPALRHILDLIDDTDKDSQELSRA